LGNTVFAEAFWCGLRANGHPAVIVTVRPVRMMQVPVDQVVRVIPVRNPLVSARRAVDVPLRMLPTVVARCAVRRILGADLKHVIVHVIAMHVMKVPIMEVVGVIAVLNSDMPTLRPVDMRMSFVHLATSLAHRRITSLPSHIKRDQSNMRSWRLLYQHVYWGHEPVLAE